MAGIAAMRVPIAIAKIVRFSELQRSFFLEILTGIGSLLLNDLGFFTRSGAPNVDVKL